LRINAGTGYIAKNPRPEASAAAVFIAFNML
jgi:hypothetical protein